MGIRNSEIWLFNDVSKILVLIYYFKKHFKPCFFYFKDILQQFKFMNWRIRFLMSRTGYNLTTRKLVVLVTGCWTIILIFTLGTIIDAIATFDFWNTLQWQNCIVFMDTLKFIHCITSHRTIFLIWSIIAIFSAITFFGQINAFQR